MTSTIAERSNWTNSGSDATAQRTYASIRTALAEIEKRSDVEVFLQGSYANKTNIRADSDIDVVVMTRRTFKGSLERLSGASRDAYVGFPNSSYSHADLRREVSDALIGYYGSSRVDPKNKCLKVAKKDGFVDADVVPCIQYRWYPRSNSDVSHDFVEGVSLTPLNGPGIINFPRAHIANGQSKNGDCSGRYKETVRQIKRLRNRAVDEGRLVRKSAPGYLLECMVFNTPADRFVYDDSDRLRDVLLWMKYATKSNFMSCDKVHRLFQTDPGGFSVDQGQHVLDALWDAF